MSAIDSIPELVASLIKLNISPFASSILSGEIGPLKNETTLVIKEKPIEVQLKMHNTKSVCGLSF
jgi:hypothetical protein